MCIQNNATLGWTSQNWTLKHINIYTWIIVIIGGTLVLSLGKKQLNIGAGGMDKTSLKTSLRYKICGKMICYIKLDALLNVPSFTSQFLIFEALAYHWLIENIAFLSLVCILFHILIFGAGLRVI